MDDVAIRVENLSKRYRIGGPQAQYKTMRESLVEMARAPARQLRRLGQPTPEKETIWALKDVSFDVKKGEVVGIIGRNGAGKTTLLRVLSRITEPTEGYAEIKGRAGSLLEVGTGFHPELTGRENIYLNGAILGMKRAEIDQRFDEIVAFSEIEKFLDTPVKRYSSGMYVRLAFSVAAHLEPEILLVDEVLAVGDAAFQKKCLGKMGDVSKEGRTVLFVSHNMRAIDRLCKSVVLLADGRIDCKGAPQEVIQSYLSDPERDHITGIWRRDDCDSRSSAVVITQAHAATDSRLDPRNVVRYDSPLMLVAEYDTTEQIRAWSLVFRIVNSSGDIVFASADTDAQPNREKWQERGRYRAICTIPGRLLKPGVYSVTMITHIPGVEVMELYENAFFFEVSSGGYLLGENRVGIIAPAMQWTTESL